MSKQNRPAPTEHEYIRRLLEIAEKRNGKLPVVAPANGHVEMQVAHEKTCKIWKGGACNCNCDVTFKAKYSESPRRA